MEPSRRSFPVGRRLTLKSSRWRSSVAPAAREAPLRVRVTFASGRRRSHPEGGPRRPSHGLRHAVTRDIRVQKLRFVITVPELGASGYQVPGPAPGRRQGPRATESKFKLQRLGLAGARAGELDNLKLSQPESGGGSKGLVTGLEGFRFTASRVTESETGSARASSPSR